MIGFLSIRIAKLRSRYLAYGCPASDPIRNALCRGDRKRSAEVGFGIPHECVKDQELLPTNQSISNDHALQDSQP